jgi:hypothetical protein
MQLALDLDGGYRETAEEIFWRVYRQMRVKSRRKGMDVSVVRLKWRAYANSISTVRLKDGEMVVGLTEALREGPAEVVEALAEILLAKVFRRQVAEEYRVRYRNWLHDEGTRGRLEALRRANGRKQAGGAAGSYHNLVEIFNEMNQRYFEGRLERVILAWSSRVSRTHLGHWDPAHRTIVLSRFLDRAEVPRLAVEYVMFHEMLHVVHPAEYDNGTRRVHHRKFKADERRFEDLKQARAILKGLGSGGGSY